MRTGLCPEDITVSCSMAVEKWNAQEFDICVYGDSGNYDFNNIRQQIHSESVGMYVIKYEGGPFEWQAWEDLLSTVKSEDTAHWFLSVE